MSSPQHDVNDEHAMGDADMDDYGVEDDEFVDMHDFSFLVTRTADLEKQVTTMIESLFQVYNLLKTLKEDIKSAHMFDDMLAKQAISLSSPQRRTILKKPKEAKGPILRRLRRQTGTATHKRRACQST